METNYQKAKRKLVDNAAISGFELPEDGFILRMLKLAATPDVVEKNDLSHIVSISLPSDKSDDIQIYASYDKSKWAVAGYGLIKEPFDNPHEALKSILAERQ